MNLLLLIMSITLITLPSNDGQSSPMSNYYNGQFGIHVEFPKSNMQGIFFNPTLDGFESSYLIDEQIITLKIFIQSATNEVINVSDFHDVLKRDLGNGLTCEVKEIDEYNLIANCKGSVVTSHKISLIGNDLVRMKIVGGQDSAIKVNELLSDVNFFEWSMNN